MTIAQTRASRAERVDDERRSEAAAGRAISRYVPLIVSPSVEGYRSAKTT